MTDLISSLADSIIALINSKPQSPTKAEVEEVLRSNGGPVWELLESIRASIDAGALASYPTSRPPEAFTNTLADCTDLNEASLEAAIKELGGAITWDAAALMPLPYKEPSPELMQLLDKARGPEACAIPCGHQLCPSSTDGSHSWTLDEYKRGNGELVAHLYRCPCGATKR